MTESLKGIAGSMFAGKTEMLIREASRAEIAGRNVLVFKPSLDDRWGIVDKIKSHSGAEHDAYVVKNALDIYNYIKPNTEVVAIDEVQFFDTKIVEVIQKLLAADIHVIFAGLSQDFRGEPFGSMPTLLALCDEIDKPTAICTEKVDDKTCGAPATKTQRLINGVPASYTDPIVLIGDEEEGYQARCPKHHLVPRESKPKTNSN
jgi:thymidine kinase